MLNGADIVVFVDYDLSWDKQDLLTLIETEGDVVSGLYRFKKDEEVYMGSIICNDEFIPNVLEDGCLEGDRIPAGFLKITKEGVAKFMEEYPELIYGPPYAPAIDLFNHGVIDNIWYGEDYAFAKRWNEKCGSIKIIPDLNLDHHSKDKSFKGNYHQFLMKQPKAA